MKVEVPRPSSEDTEPTVVARAGWNGRDVLIEADDRELRDSVGRAFRRTPVVVDDASARRMGTSGAVLIEPGGLEWFRAVALVRVPREAGLLPVLVADIIEGGYDPAANYRTFEAQIERLNERPESRS